MATVNYDGLARDYAQHRRAVPSLTGALLQGGSLTRGSRVSELGCGTGNYVCSLEDAVGCACWGIDRSGEMLGRAQAHYPRIAALPAVPQDAFGRGLARLERDPSAGPVAGVLRQTALWANKPDRASSTGSPLGSLT
jgi:SAM-dependent methyltransferase